MSEIKSRERYTSVSQRQMINDNRRFLIEAILDSTKTLGLYQYYYPRYAEILKHQFEEKRVLRKTLNETNIDSYIARLQKMGGYVRNSTREIFREYLLTLPEQMCEERKQVSLKGLASVD